MDATKKWAAWLCCLILLDGSRSSAANVSPPCALRNITIGALVDFDSTLAPSVKKAMQLAISDLNQIISSDGGWLRGSCLSLVIADTSNDAFHTTAAAMELLKQNAIAIAGPQSTTGSHFIAHMCTTLKVPIVSYGATDPALSEHQYPFFLRLAHNDVHQMQAVADLIKFYGWRTVVALYTDDDFGANGITALEDALMQQVSPSMFRRERLIPGIDRNGVGSILARLAMMESRIFVVHAEESVGLRVLAEAQYLGMMNTGFVWIVTNLLAYSIEMRMQHGDMAVVREAQGVLGVRRYVPPSARQEEVWARVSNSSRRGMSWDDMNVYAMCAYDSVWLIGEGLRGMGSQNLSFEEQPGMEGEGLRRSELMRLKVFRQGDGLRQAMVHARFDGTTGSVRLDDKGDILAVSFEIVNFVGRGLRTVGYWSQLDGIAALPVDLSSNLSPSTPATSIDDNNILDPADGTDLKPMHDRPTAPVKLPDVIWPGGGIQVPRGWVIPQNGRPLMIGVPKKAGYKELIRQSVDARNNVTTFHGFCINVFEAAVRYLPYAVTYQFVSLPGSDNSSTPIYDDLIAQLAIQKFDALVADATITKNRLDLVDFTQPYIESGLEIMVPLVSSRPNTRWAFLQPFTPALWLTIGAFFLFTGAVIWMLEHKLNPAYRGRLRNQVINSLWFIFSTLFFAQREKTKSFLGRFVVILWLFVVLIITSSYTASLTSILTVQQLSPSMLGIHSLLASDLAIGYQMGSFVKDYLVELGIKAERLVPLQSKAMYAKALRLGPDNGGVAAIVDEMPYLQLFLASEGSTEFTTAGQEFTKSGWAYAFPRGSQLTADMSEAILRMSENGELQKLHNLWFNSQEEKLKDTDVNSSQLDLKPFSGLFMISGLVSTLCLIAYIIRLFKDFMNSNMWNESDIRSCSSLSRSTQFFKSFAIFMNEPVDRDSTRSNNVSQEIAMSHVLGVSPVSSFER